LIFYPTFERWGSLEAAGVVALWISMLLALGSAAEYLHRFFRMLPLADEGGRKADTSKGVSA